MSTSKTQAEIDAANRFASFVRGWRHGAIRKAMCPKHLAHKTLAVPYTDGYRAGLQDSLAAEKNAAARYNHEQTALRSDP